MHGQNQIKLYIENSLRMNLNKTLGLLNETNLVHNILSIFCKFYL